MSNAIKDGISNSMECLHASEKTYEEVMSVIEKSERAKQPRAAWSWAKVAAVALVAVLVIGTGAYAVTTGLFANLFGLRGYGEVDPGNHMQGVQWFDTSEELATALVGDKVQHVGQTIEHDGYVLTVHDFVVDSNGAAIAWATLTNEDGLDDRIIQADGHLFKYDMIGPDWDGPFQYIKMNPASGGNEKDNHGVMVNRETATETSLDLTFYYVSYDCKTPESLEWSMGFSEETWGYVDTVVKTDPVAVTAVAEAVTYGTEKGWDVNVSPLSIRVKRSQVSTVDELKIAYNDGTELLIEDESYLNVAVEIANMDGDVLMVPTGLMNPNEIASVTVNGNSFVDPWIYSDEFFDPSV